MTGWSGAWKFPLGNLSFPLSFPKLEMIIIYALHHTHWSLKGSCLRPPPLRDRLTSLCDVSLLYTLLVYSSPLRMNRKMGSRHFPDFTFHILKNTAGDCLGHTCCTQQEHFRNMQQRGGPVSGLQELGHLSTWWKWIFTALTAFFFFFFVITLEFLSA